MMKSPIAKCIPLIAGLALFTSCGSSKEEAPEQTKTQEEVVEKKTVTPDIIPGKDQPGRNTVHIAKKSTADLSIDGKLDDAAWASAEYYNMDNIWLGDTTIDASDFTGRFKTVWTEAALYIAVEVTDDTIIDIHSKPLDNYWNDDCVEIFIDEDNSDGNHQFNYNAFAYHIAQDGKVADIGIDSVPHLYNKHVQTARGQGENGTDIWEMKFTIYNDSFVYGEDNTAQVLSAGKELGLAVAYCDNDTSSARENFIGSMPIIGKDRDRGWIDAGVFGTLKLEE